MFKSTIRSLVQKIGYEVCKIQSSQLLDMSELPDAELYRPTFSPWLSKGAFESYYKLAADRTLVSRDRCYVLYTLLRQAIYIDGDIWECGVYKGGTAAMIAAILKDIMPSKQLYLFDTFEGMPETDSDKDRHKKGDFSDTTIEAVKKYVGCDDLCTIRKGFIPDTFAGLESKKIAFVHIDVDVYKSVLDCLHFVWSRLSFGGIIVFDDYGFPSCPGARIAVDEFFSTEKCVPLCLPTAQALVFKGIV